MRAKIKVEDDWERIDIQSRDKRTKVGRWFYKKCVYRESIDVKKIKSKGEQVLKC